jgi:putative addiction module killer protein
VNPGSQYYVLEVFQSETYQKWFKKLRDPHAQARIDARIRRLSLGNAGDAKGIGRGISELRIDYGPGYRVYIMQRGLRVVVLLCGGDKRTQDSDIARAIQIAANWK